MISRKFGPRDPVPKPVRKMAKPLVLPERVESALGSLASGLQTGTYTVKGLQARLFRATGERVHPSVILDFFAYLDPVGVHVVSNRGRPRKSKPAVKPPFEEVLVTPQELRRINRVPMLTGGMNGSWVHRLESIVRTTGMIPYFGSFRSEFPFDVESSGFEHWVKKLSQHYSEQGVVLGRVLPRRKKAREE